MARQLGRSVSSGIVALVTLLPDNHLMTWGWRVPFLLSFVFLFIALYIRLKVEESPVWTNTVETVTTEEKSSQKDSTHSTFCYGVGTCTDCHRCSPVCIRWVLPDDHLCRELRYEHSWNRLMEAADRNNALARHLKQSQSILGRYSGTVGKPGKLSLLEASSHLCCLRQFCL